MNSFWWIITVCQITKSNIFNVLAGNQEVKKPENVCVDSDDNIYILDCGNKEIKKIDKDKRISVICQNIKNPKGISIDENNRIFFIDDNGIHMVQDKSFINIKIPGEENFKRSFRGIATKFNCIFLIDTTANELIQLQYTSPDSDFEVEDDPYEREQELPAAKMIQINTLPNALFPPHYCPDVNVHMSVFNILKKEPTFKEEDFKKLKSDVENKLLKISSSTLGLPPMISKLSPNERTAVIYYTSNCPVPPLYKTVNETLASRDVPEEFLPYLYYLVQGLLKLPHYNGTVYRILNDKVPKLSKAKEVEWVAFSSTTLTQPDKTLSNMHKWLKLINKKKYGTVMMIHVIEGRVIAQLSLFPNEKEVLLLPNSQLEVVEFLGEDMKKLLRMEEDVDFVVLQQKPVAMDVYAMWKKE
eukprot:TRINITY_DN1373_c0_g1_i11.p1 TRINITY_DN1373_c0_g1~~TRINITY_DN1373_c0_g1_i11.p1  ORF type:complete len:414 (+),score=117.62 TRINITY_DN1373_c0_g1_i11:464-1705(+)